MGTTGETDWTRSDKRGRSSSLGRVKRGAPEEVEGTRSPRWDHASPLDGLAGATVERKGEHPQNAPDQELLEIAPYPVFQSRGPLAGTRS